MEKHRRALGLENPHCDKIQSIILPLFFLIWAIDSLSHYLFNLSTTLFEFTTIPLILIPAIIFLILGIYLVLKSHQAVFNKSNNKPKFINSGVYSIIRHPMYLGILLFCLGFLFLIFSLLSFIIWIIFFIFYDKMATYEENNLIQILGEKYINYQKQVGKWVPKIKSSKQ